METYGEMGQKFSFGFSDPLIAEVGGVTLHQLHFDAEAIVRAYEKFKSVAERLGIEPPKPHLAGFCYPHIASLGVKFEFPEDSEPSPSPLISSPEDIDKLKEPDDYLSAPIIQKKLAALKELKKLFPEARNSIGHLYEGPVTTAVLIMGKDFLMLPYDDPEKAHKLLTFCVESALHYANRISEYFNQPIQPGPKGIPDDFAGMFSPPVFKEFIVPYWDKIYRGLSATERSLHSELLRVEHLPFLKELKIKTFDPSADQYLTGEILSKHCPCEFTLRIQAWDIRDLSPEKLEKMYIEFARYKPCRIFFSMENLDAEPKIKKLLKIARRMEEDNG